MKPFIDLQMLQDATRKWRSSKATKQTRTRRCNTFKCCKMLLGDDGDERRPRGCNYPTPPYYITRECFAHYKYISYFFNKIRPCIRIHPGTPRVPPRALASGPKPWGGNKVYYILYHIRTLKKRTNLPCSDSALLCVLSQCDFHRQNRNTGHNQANEVRDEKATLKFEST